MRSLIKILLASLLLIESSPFTYAQEAPDMFVVDISPSSFEVNTPVDLTIRAVKANGEVVKDYQGDVFIDVVWSLDTSEYTVPSEWLYSFLPQDQWVKTFSKWLIIKKAGTFSISASDISEDTIQGKWTVIVWDAKETKSTTTSSITITSPTSGSIIKSDVAEIIGEWWVKNSPFEILLNGDSSYQWTTDAKWSFVWYISNLVEWENTIQIRISDINDVVVAESDEIKITYTSPTDGSFNSIQILPDNTITAWSKATFKVKTSDTVSSATIKLSNGRSAPMDLESEGSFVKDITIDTTGKLDVSLDISVSGKTKSYTNISMVIVETGTTIGKVRAFSDSVYKDKLSITWDVEWNETPKYLVAFWESADNLDQSQVVTGKEIILTNLPTWTKYYFQITPLNNNWEKAGSPSEIINAIVWDGTQMSCTVEGIKVNDVIEGNFHFLTRDAVQNVEKYIIYRSDEKTSIDNMQKVWETTENKFEYPFNPDAKEVKYSYYAVQAICKDGKAIVMDDIKKVKTWPMEDILLFVFIGLFFYASYKLYNFNKA